MGKFVISSIKIGKENPAIVRLCVGYSVIYINEFLGAFTLFLFISGRGHIGWPITNTLEDWALHK
jgi:hypothetical protein